MDTNKQNKNLDNKSKNNNKNYDDYDYSDYSDYSDYDDFGLNSSGARGGGKNNTTKTDVKKNKNISCYSSKHVRKINNKF